MLTEGADTMGQIDRGDIASTAQIDAVEPFWEMFWQSSCQKPRGRL
jgi:hypothetical protein